MCYQRLARVSLCSDPACLGAGVWQNDRVEIIANDQGNRTTPSYVAFTDSERLIGDAAKSQVALNPSNTCACHPRPVWMLLDPDLLVVRPYNDECLCAPQASAVCARLMQVSPQVSAPVLSSLHTCDALTLAPCSSCTCPGTALTQASNRSHSWPRMQGVRREAPHRPQVL